MAAREFGFPRSFRLYAGKDGLAGLRSTGGERARRACYVDRTNRTASPYVWSERFCRRGQAKGRETWYRHMRGRKPTRRRAGPSPGKRVGERSGPARGKSHEARADYASAMIKFGYSLSGEEMPPKDLVRYARRAEEAGFGFALISDHYHPWIEIGIAGDAVLLRPCAATDRRIIGIRHSWKNRVHSLEKSPLRHKPQRRQPLASR